MGRKVKGERGFNIGKSKMKNMEMKEESKDKNKTINRKCRGGSRKRTTN
jgi:hypothetical protein